MEVSDAAADDVRAFERRKEPLEAREELRAEIRDDEAWRLAARLTRAAIIATVGVLA